MQDGRAINHQGVKLGYNFDPYRVSSISDDIEDDILYEMFRILESQAPAKQTATTTIATLSGRLQSATLLEDRRAAILGLRSFSKIYPASVASGALRGLISCLKRDAGDVDTAKIVLETLLMLFDPDQSSPEASDDIALWLADEFTQNEDNIKVVLDLLDTHDFYSRLYSLQLISAISAARPVRTQECVYMAALGASRLVSVLDDKREAVRSEGLQLLTALTPSSTELQKLVAFENAFDRIFAIIHAEGSLSHGGATVEDCLSLLANLLRLNASNQSSFRETGFVARSASLLSEAIRDQKSPEGIADWARTQRDKNVWGLLVVLRLFLLPGATGTQSNQTSFSNNGLLHELIEIAFNQGDNLAIRAEALDTCADIIKGNSNLQEKFAQLDASAPIGKEVEMRTNGHPPRTAPLSRTNVISALLDLALTCAPTQAFDVRMAACRCLQAYFYRHSPIRLHFLRRAIDGLVRRDEANNVLQILMEGSKDTTLADPYRCWIASALLFHLLNDDFDAKTLAMEAREGDAANGEEVITCIQAISANLISSALQGGEEREAIGYLMVLCGWIYEDHNAVNDFLGEGSHVQNIVQLISMKDENRILVTGLCTFLLGILYEFSTKDSPIPRTTLHQILAGLKRENYAENLTRLRGHPMVRDFEVLPQNIVFSSASSLPEVYFDAMFMEFFKDNFSRIARAIDRPPDFEIPVITNGMQKGVSRELIDALEAKIHDQTQSIQLLETLNLNLERSLEQEQADHRRVKESAAVELNRIRSINDGLQRNHEAEIQKLGKETNDRVLSVQKNHEFELQSLQAEMDVFRENSEAAAANVRARHDAEIEDLKTSIHSLKTELEKNTKEHVQDLQTAHDDYSLKLTSLETRLQRAEDKANDAEARALKAKNALAAKEEARQTAQTELDDLLMVLGDLEDKRARDKERLAALGEQVSDREDD